MDAMELAKASNNRILIPRT